MLGCNYFAAAKHFNIYFAAVPGMLLFHILEYIFQSPPVFFHTFIYLPFSLVLSLP